MNRNLPQSRIWSGHTMPVFLDCKFIVNSSDSAGLGITSLKGAYVQNVFMHTSATPGSGNSNPQTPGIKVVNPNPASGTIIVQLSDAFNGLITHGHAIIDQPNGSAVAVGSPANNLTPGVAYTITVLGDATAADWLALGVPAGITPAVGVSFIALVAGHGAGTTSRVAPSAAAGSAMFTMELVGNPDLSMAPNPASGQGYGAQLIFQSRNDSSGDASQIAAIADGTQVSIWLMLSNSSIKNGSAM